MPVSQYKGRPVVRSTCKRESPFLRSLLPVIRAGLDASEQYYHRQPTVLDLGCGSGRNGRALARDCWVEVLSFDRMPGPGVFPIELGGKLPLFSSSVDLVLFQFVAMFLDQDALLTTLKEINRVASRPCLAVVEVAAVKNCRTPTVAEARDLCQDMRRAFETFGWKIYRPASMHFLASASWIDKLLVREQRALPVRSTSP